MAGDVVVGVSPRSGSPTALRWAAAEAALRSTRLRAVMAWKAPSAPGTSGTRPPLGLDRDPMAPAVEAEDRLRGFVDAALGAGHGVECSVVHGSELTALVTAAEGAALLVIGEPTAGRAAAMRAGLVAPQLVFKSRCPVVVMPAEAPDA